MTEMSEAFEQASMTPDEPFVDVASGSPKHAPGAMKSR